MRYVVERDLQFSPRAVWRVLADVRHFAAGDPFHRDLAFQSARREGAGTTFTVRHSYLPIFPFPGDRVTCTVTDWQPPWRITLAEKNRWRLKDHTQQFTVLPGRAGARLRYEIFYRGVPWALPALRLWAGFMVRRRMAEKLREVEEACARA